MLTTEWSRGNSNEVLQFCPRCWSILQPFHSNSKTLEDWGNLAQSENAPARFTRIGWRQIWRNLAQQSGKAKEVQCQSYVMSWFLHRLSNMGGGTPEIQWLNGVWKHLLPHQSCQKMEKQSVFPHQEVEPCLAPCGEPPEQHRAIFNMIQGGQTTSWYMI